jgi:hypothetical protein
MPAWNRLRPLIYAELVVVAVLLALRAPWGNGWDGYDFGVYVQSAQRLLLGASPYFCQENGCYVYSPAFAVLATPLTLLPGDLGLALWRLGGVMSLILATRGLGPAGLIVFCIPGLWESDLVAGNVMAFATAAMFAVVRWPSVRTVVAYAVLVAIIPKPQFLPVLLYGLWRVREARLGSLAVGVAGLVMLAWPGYLAALLHQPEIARAEPWLPLPLAVAASLGLAVAGWRWPPLLGPAAVLAAPYALPYTMVPLGLLGAKPRAVSPDRSPRLPSDQPSPKPIDPTLDGAAVARARVSPARAPAIQHDSEVAR